MKLLKSKLGAIWCATRIKSQSSFLQITHQVLKINSDYWAVVFLWNHYILWIDTKTSMFKQYFITATLTSVPIPLIIDIWHLILRIWTSVVYLACNLQLQFTNCWNRVKFWSINHLNDCSTDVLILTREKSQRTCILYLRKGENIEIPHAISFLSVFAAFSSSWPESRGNSFCYRMMFWNALRHKIQHREIVNKNPLLVGV